MSIGSIILLLNIYIYIISNRFYDKGKKDIGNLQIPMSYTFKGQYNHQILIAPVVLTRQIFNRYIKEILENLRFYSKLHLPNPITKIFD